MPTRRNLRIQYTDFWPGFEPHDNFLSQLLSERFDLEISSDPDLLIYSCYGYRNAAFRDYDCLRLLVSWENRSWGFSDTDFAITCDVLDHPDHRRFPFYAVGLQHPFEQPQIDPIKSLAEKTGFAAVVVSNGAGLTRNRIHDLVHSYKVVDSGGRFRNNVGGPVPDKLRFIARYKFCLALENSSSPGYTTEKIVDALKARTIPIYWGDPEIATEFNPARFLNYHDFESESSLLRRIIELDEDDEAYRAMLSESWFVGEDLPESAQHEPLLDWLEARISDGRVPKAQRRSPLIAARRLEDRWAMRRRYRSRIL